MVTSERSDDNDLIPQDQAAAHGNLMTVLVVASLTSTSLLIGSR
ncbi:MAG: hypothetical protein AAFY56_11810 [Pseudomonadota bacterium]